MGLRQHKPCPHPASYRIHHVGIDAKDYPGDPFCTDCALEHVTATTKRYGVKLAINNLDGTPVDKWALEALTYEPSKF